MMTSAQKDVCIFTIVSNNYLHYANALFESLRRYCPGVDLFLGLCDRQTEETECPAATEIISIDRLDIPALGTFIYQYSILELNTAVKPYLIEVLMSRGYGKIIYFDPDILVFRQIDEMIGLLDRHTVLLTPHLTDTMEDGRIPGELQIIQAGTYNLGFIALRNCEETRKLVKWWQRKLYQDCVVDLTRGLFVDQKWMDLVPGIFEGVHINRDPAWNVAYWNLAHRLLEQDASGEFLVNGRPLLFFHFSGYSARSGSLSKHQNRFDKGHAGEPLRELCSIFDAALLRNGFDRFSALPYSFGSFADGTPVPDSARPLIRSNEKLRALDYFDGNQCAAINSELNRPIPGKRSPLGLTALAMALWNSRPDLADAFPDVEGVDRIRFAQWVASTAQREAGFSEVHLQPIRQALLTAASGEITGTGVSQLMRPFRAMLRFAWRHRERIPLRIRLAMPSLARWALRHAHSSPFEPEVSAAIPTSSVPGINLIGYLSAESGVGEAARASLRALRKSGLPFSLVDYRVGNVSRMGEVIEVRAARVRYPINLMHVNADQSRIARDHLGSELFDGRYTIGFWYWEMPEFPPFLHFAYEQVDEIWVATEYTRESIARHTDKPVRVIPPAIELRIDKPLTRAELHMPEDSFIFFHMSDVLSVPERKNPIGVVKAFLLAFADQPAAKVKLVIKLSNLDFQPSLSVEMFGLMERDPRIQVIHEYLDRNTLNNLLGACDCYVSLHRAEGFGLPIAEAMYLGKPVIATHWSGNVDMMDTGNSYPVRYQLVSLEKDHGPYLRGQQWAEPDLAHAAQLMQRIIHAGNEALTDVCARARQTIREKYSPTSAAARINERVAQILSTPHSVAASRALRSTDP